MNLFVAAILEHFADLSDLGNGGVQQRLMESLGTWVRQWEEFDPEVKNIGDGELSCKHNNASSGRG